MRQVSLMNYYDQQFVLNKREKEVYDILKELGPCTSWDILWKLGVHNPNYVRPRLTDLQEKGLVKTVGKKKVAGINQYLWQVREEQE
jgi:predicted ArsR family transcriptional regulator